MFSECSPAGGGSAVTVASFTFRSGQWAGPGGRPSSRRASRAGLRRPPGGGSGGPGRREVAGAAEDRVDDAVGAKSLEAQGDGVVGVAELGVGEGQVDAGDGLSAG